MPFWNSMKGNLRIVLGVLFFLTLLRITGFTVGLAIVNSAPPPNIDEVYKLLGPLQIACWADVGTFETILIDYRKKTLALLKKTVDDPLVIESIRDNITTSGAILDLKDPYSFSNEIRWFRKNSQIFIYSIGPDKINDLGLLKYDPTNGSFSRGDLIIGIHK